MTVTAISCGCKSHPSVKSVLIRCFFPKGRSNSPPSSSEQRGFCLLFYITNHQQFINHSCIIESTDNNQPGHDDCSCSYCRCRRSSTPLPATFWMPFPRHPNLGQFDEGRWKGGLQVRHLKNGLVAWFFCWELLLQHQLQTSMAGSNMI